MIDKESAVPKQNTLPQVVFQALPQDEKTQILTTATTVLTTSTSQPSITLFDVLTNLP